MTNYGCILKGIVTGTAQLLDGWKGVENEDSFDVITAEYVARAEADIPAKFSDVGSDFGWSCAYVVQREVTEEGDAFVGRLQMKGIKTVGGFKVRGDSVSNLSRTIGQQTIGTSIFDVPLDVVQFNPIIQILRVDTSPSANSPGDVVTPPVIPTPPVVFGTGTIKNEPWGWVVTTIRHEGVGGSYGTAVTVPLWLIDETYQYIQEWANGYNV